MTRPRLSDTQALWLLAGYFVVRMVMNRVGIAYLPQLLEGAPWAIPLLNNSQIILIAAGTEVRTSLPMQLATGATALMMCMVIGSILYWVGHRFGPILATKASEVGSLWASIWNPRQIERANRWLNKQGWWAVALARAIEWLVTPVVLVAGASRMALKRFYAAYLVGSIAFVSITLWVGALAGDRWPWLPDRIKEFAEWSLRIAIGLLVFALLAMLLAKRLGPPKEDQPEAEGDPEASAPSEGATVSAEETARPEGTTTPAHGSSEIAPSTD